MLRNNHFLSLPSITNMYFYVFFLILNLTRKHRVSECSGSIMENSKTITCNFHGNIFTCMWNPHSIYAIVCLIKLIRYNIVQLCYDVKVVQFTTNMTQTPGNCRSCIYCTFRILIHYKLILLVSISRAAIARHR